jgi:hypothetical protein
MVMQNLKSLYDEDDDDVWIRRLTLSEEYIRRHHPSLRGGYYRWFESPNVVDLVRIRRLRFGQLQGVQRSQLNDD